MSTAAANRVDREAPQRTLAHVLLELRQVKLMRQSADRLCSALYTTSRADGSDDGSYGRACDDFAAADERLSDLRDEAGAMIGELTGVAWDQIQDAML